MADVKKFLDQTGTGYLWGKIKTELNKKAAQADLEALQATVQTIQENAYDDTALKNRMSEAETAIATKAAQTDLTTLEGKVTTLIGDDASKSVRTIANEELAARLIAADADESLDTLQEIAAWIQAHPEDAATMNSKISALETKTQLGLDSNNQEYATVKAYVEGYVGSAVAAVHSHDNKAVLDGITATLISNWDEAYTKAHVHANATTLDGITAEKVAAWDSAEASAKAYADGLAGNYATTAQGAKADTALQPADVIALTSAEIDAAIASANS